MFGRTLLTLHLSAIGEMTSKVSHNEICTYVGTRSAHISTVLEIRAPHIMQTSKALAKRNIGLAWVRSDFRPDKLDSHLTQLLEGIYGGYNLLEVLSAVRCNTFFERLLVIFKIFLKYLSSSGNYQKNSYKKQTFLFICWKFTVTNRREQRFPFIKLNKQEIITLFLYWTQS